MQELISTAILIATLVGGTMVAKNILDEVRIAALSKAASGLPSLSHFSKGLTKTAKPIQK